MRKPAHRKRRPGAILAAALFLFGESAPSWAQVVQQIVPVSAAPGAAPVCPIRPDLGAGAPSLQFSPAPGLSLPALQSLIPPARLDAAAVQASIARTPDAGAVVAAAAAVFSRAPSPGLTPAEAKKSFPASIAGLRKTASEDGAALRKSEGEAAGDGAARSFEKLLGLRSAAAAAWSAEPVPVDPAAAPKGPSLSPAGGARAEATVRVPAAPRPSAVRNVRLALTATGIFKIGMEALAISVPLIALTTFGSAVWMATMAVAWGASMTLSSLFAGGLLDRKPVQRVIAGAMAAQAVSVSAMILLFMVGAANPFLILPLHALSGAAMGIITSGRDTLPARLLGRDHRALSRYNSKTHIVYETTGTIAPLLTGLLIAKVGVVAGLFLHPPAYILAAIIFSRLDLSAREGAAAPSPADPAPTGRGAFKKVVSDIREGAEIIFSTKELRWLAFMVLVPMVIHRVVEQIMVPVFAKTVLGAAAKAAWVVSASNFGELVGAALLLKTITSAQRLNQKVSRYRWIPLMALGTLATWSLSVPGGLALILPLIFFMGATWSANDISLTSYFQSRLPDESAGKAVGFLMAAELGIIMAVSYLLGFLFDLVPARAAFLAVNLALTVLAGLFWYGQKKLREASPPQTVK